ncbi:serine hydrolase domain-containing protein, partial [Paenibacillus senegalensis]|uniref:serine hydrolase domain-containing protein n=1 Tax=Paenibacillus senegalensis TaxID=1465766 RepID=UPI00138ABC2B
MINYLLATVTGLALLCIALFGHSTPYHAYAAALAEPAGEQSARGAKEKEELAASAATYMEQVFEELKVPGAAFALVHDGEIVYSDAWGITGGEKRAVGTDTPFLLGSISKSITAYGIMRLVQEGLIELDTPVQAYVPWFTAAEGQPSERITVRQLLSHTSGFSSSSGFALSDLGDQHPDAIQRTAQQLSSIVLTAEPGERYQYSNANFITAAVLIEEVTGLKYADYMDQYVFTPLGMHNAGADNKQAEEHGWQPGYRSWFGFSISSEIPYDNAGAPYGYISASVIDMARFIAAMQNPGEALTAEFIDEMVQPVVQTSARNHYALGWRITPADLEQGGTRIWHAGSTPDHLAHLFLLPESGWGAVILTNRNNRVEEVSMLYVVNGLREILTGGEPSPFQAPRAAERWV